VSMAPAPCWQRRKESMGARRILEVTPDYRGRDVPKAADIGSKRLVSLAPDAWVQWITGQPDAVVREVLAEEFQWIGRASDVVLRAYSPQTGEFGMVNEVQLRYTNHMPRRMFAYSGLGAEKLKLPIYAVLVNLLPPAEGTVIADHYEQELLGLRMRVDYRVINLWEVDVGIVFEKPLPPLLPFVPLFRGGGDEAVVRRALRDLRADEELSELEPLLAFFASFVLETDLVQQIMRWDMAVLTESPFYQQIVREGELKAAREGVLEALDMRLGPVPVEVAEKVRAAADLGRLKALHRLAIAANSWEEFLPALDEE